MCTRERTHAHVHTPACAPALAVTLSTLPDPLRRGSRGKGAKARSREKSKLLLEQSRRSHQVINHDDEPNVAETRQHLLTNNPQDDGQSEGGLETVDNTSVILEGPQVIDVDNCTSPRHVDDLSHWSIMDCLNRIVDHGGI